MTGPLLSQKYIFFKNVGKNYQNDFESTLYKKKWLNMFRKIIFHGTIYLVIAIGDKYV